MGAEDFADYLPVVPGCMIGLGAKGPDRKITPLHTATFDIDETALLIGARLFAAVLLEWPKKSVEFRKKAGRLSAGPRMKITDPRIKIARVN